MEDQRTRIVEMLLAIVARAVYSDGVVEDAERELVKRVVRALEVDHARARQILDTARKEAPMRSNAGAADAEMLWAEAQALLGALPAGTGRRALAARVGWALEVDDARIAEVVQALAPDAPARAGVVDSARSYAAEGLAAEAAALAARLDPHGAPFDEKDGRSMLELLNSGDLAVVATLARCASRTGQLAALDPALTALVATRAPAGAELGVYQAALAGAAAGVTREDDPATGNRLIEVVDLAERLAKVEPQGPERWIAWAERAREAVRFLCRQRDWKSVRALEKRLGAAPRAHEGAVAPAVAGALAAWGLAALVAQAGDELARARDRLARLSGRHDLAAVRREYATLLAAVIAGVVRDRFPDAAEGPLAAGLLESLAQAHWEDRDLVLIFAAACADVQLLHVAARDEAGHRKLLARLSELAQRHPRDEDLALHLARGLVNVGVVRAGDLAPARREKDPLLVAVRALLDLLRESNPTSEKVAELAGRFDRQPGVPPSRIRAAPAARARHPDLLELRDAFERLQHGSNDAMATLARILGVGPYPGRIMREGEEAYQRDEGYFLDLLAEIDHQVQHDRSGYWRMQMPKLDTMTRYMLEDATPAIAQAARDLRGRLNLAAK